MTYLLLLLTLFIGHFVADFVLQPDAMAKGKNRNNKPDLAKIPAGQTPATLWPWFLTAHTATHAGMVLFITLNAWFMLAEFILHWVIDYNKTGNKFGPHTDQSLHLACKLLYVGMVATGFASLPPWIPFITF